MQVKSNILYQHFLPYYHYISIFFLSLFCIFTCPKLFAQERLPQKPEPQKKKLQTPETKQVNTRNQSSRINTINTKKLASLYPVSFENIAITPERHSEEKNSSQILLFAQQQQTQNTNLKRGETLPEKKKENKKNRKRKDIVRVIGSRIKREDISNISPTLQITGKDFKNSGESNALDFLEELPQLNGSESIRSNQYSFGDQGVRRANLRGVGAFRALTLVGHRRRAATPTSFFGYGSFDWNVLPNNLIKDITLYTGGASAIYGSDAVSGVINVELEDRLNGVNIGGFVNTDAKSRYTNYTTYLSLGKIFRKGRFILHTEYDTNDELTAKEAGRDGLASWINNNRPNWSGGDIHFDGNVNTPITPDAEYNSVPFLRVGDAFNGYFANALPNFTGHPELWPFRGYRNIDENGNVGKDIPRRMAGTRPSDGRYSDNWIDGTANPSIYDKKLGKFRKINLGSDGLLNFWGCNLDNGCELNVQDTTWWSPTEHVNFYGNAHYDLTPEIEFITEIIYSQSEGITNLDPIFIRRGDRVSLSKNIDRANLSVLDNKNSDFPEIIGTGLNPLFTPALHEQLTQLDETGFNVTRSLVEFGPRITSRKQNYVDVSIGFEGQTKFNWLWDFYYDYGYNSFSFTRENNIYGARWQNSLDIVIDDASGKAVCRSAKARAEGCIAVDLLNGISPEAVRYLNAPGDKTTFNSDQHLILTTLSGDTEPFFKLPAGSISFATGFEFRTERLQRKTSDFFANGEDFNANKLPSFKTSNTVTEGFVEFIIPLLKDLPFIKRLKLETALRLTKYQKGSSDLIKTYKFGGRWSVLKDLEFRAVLARSIRAPHPVELSLPDSIGFIGYTDPCSFTSLANTRQMFRRANCRALLGLTDEELDRFSGLNTGQDISGGNPNLFPETSDSFTAGAIIRPRFIPNLNIIVDYFSIDIMEIISQLGQQAILNLCVDTQSLNNQYCPLITRNSTTHQIQLVRDTFVNANENLIEGIDADISYNFSVREALKLLPWKSRNSQDLGIFYFSLIGEHLINDLWIDSFGNKTQRAGRFTRPDWTFRVAASYWYKTFSLNWTTNWVGRTNRDASQPRWNTSDITYHNLSVSYAIRHKERKLFSARFGIRNLFNEGPRPHTWTYNGGQYDQILGRQFWASLDLQF